MPLTTIIIRNDFHTTECRVRVSLINHEARLSLAQARKIMGLCLTECHCHRTKPESGYVIDDRPHGLFIAHDEGGGSDAAE